VKRLAWLVALVFALFGAEGCTVGDGSGFVRTEPGQRLYVKGCWNGPFDLQPDFFAANPYRAESLMIRIQRGDNNEEASDGLNVTVTDISAVKKAMASKTAIPVGLPNGVAPPGQPLTGAPSPLVSLTLYLHQTCHEQNSATYSVSGSITFNSIFSGDPNEKDTDARLTDADFAVKFADPRELVDAPDSTLVTSDVVNGHFRFFFQRGQPAQPFQ
jgi:hypothetical protein